MPSKNHKPEGSARTRAGPIMASADKFEISLRGRGGHAAMPHQTPDAILAASALVLQLNTIISRRVDPVGSAVLSVTKIEGGHAHNVIPERVTIVGTVRSFDPAVQDRIEQSIREMCEGAAKTHGLDIAATYDRYYPATINDADAAREALAAAAAVCGDAAEAPAPAFTSEDFSFMLRERPGAYLWLGQRDDTHQSPLHHPAYDFNEKALPIGIAWFTALAEKLLAPGSR